MFTDLGLKNTVELQARADLTHQIYKIIKQKKFTQTEVVELLGLKCTNFIPLLLLKCPLEAIGEWCEHVGEE